MSYLHDYFLTPPSTSNMNINIRKRPGERVNTTDVKRTHNNSEVLQQNDCYQANQVHYGNFPNPNFNFYSNQNQIPSMYTWNQGTPFTPPRDPFQGLSYTNIQTPGNYAPIPNSMFCTPESDTSSNNSQYFGAPMTSVQYEKQMVYSHELVPEPVVGPSSSPPLPPQTLLGSITTQLTVEGHIQKSEPKKPNLFHCPHPMDSFVLDKVEGRLPIVLDMTRYDLTAEEMRRRISAPEFLNLSALFIFFRKCKKKDGTQEVKDLLKKCELRIEKTRAHLPISVFTFTFEAEMLAFAKQIDLLYNSTFPHEILAWKLLEDMTDSGLTLNLCLKKLEWSHKALATLVSIYEEIQPKVVGLEEKYRGCALDEKFAELSLATHGFLHPHSISSFQHVCKVLEIACQNAESVMNGTRTMREVEEVVDGEKPFQNMSDNAFMYWQGKPFGMISKRLEDEIVIIENSVKDVSGELEKEGDEDLEPMMENAKEVLWSELKRLEIDFQVDGEEIEIAIVEQDVEEVEERPEDVLKSILFSTAEETLNHELFAEEFETLIEYWQNSEDLVGPNQEEIDFSLNLQNFDREMLLNVINEICQQYEEEVSKEPSQEQFLFPTIQQLREMSTVQLKLLPVPSGEHSDFWLDKALIAQM